MDTPSGEFDLTENTTKVRRKDPSLELPAFAPEGAEPFFDLDEDQLREICRRFAVPRGWTGDSLRAGTKTSTPLGGKGRAS